MPAISLVDLRKERPPRGGFISPPLRQALLETLAAEGQSLLFINRRGYAPLTLCRACGYRLACSNCSAWLVAHRLRGRLQCHHCGLTIPAPEHCPSCGSVGTLVASGPGVERLAEEVAHVLPDARVVVMTSDTVPNARAAAELVAAVERREVDVLIGTQIIAKGHHFPALTLVGVVDADVGLGAATCGRRSGPSSSSTKWRAAPAASGARAACWSRPTCPSTRSCRRSPTATRTASSPPSWRSAATAPCRPTAASPP